MARNKNPTQPETPEVVVEDNLVENPTTESVTTATTESVTRSTTEPVAGAAGGAPEPAAAGAAPAAPPGMVTLKAPANSGSHITFQGVLIEIKDGFVTVEHYIAKHLKEAFGFTSA
jgi:hypothetical protein